MVRNGLKNPGAAGLVFGVLLLATLSLLRQSLQSDPTLPGGWLMAQRWPLSIALNLVPFAGIAFLWFLGVLRHKLGVSEADSSSWAFCLLQPPFLAPC